MTSAERWTSELKAMGWTAMSGRRGRFEKKGVQCVVDLFTLEIDGGPTLLLSWEGDDPRSMKVLLDIAAHAALDRAVELSRVYIALAQTYDSGAGTRSTVDETTDGQGRGC